MDKDLGAAHAVLEQAIADQAFPGAAYGVLHDGEVTLGSVGTFTYEEQSLRVAPGTVYDLASVSKVVATTAAAMLLYQRGKLDLDARVGDLLPGFVIGMRRGSGRERVTIRMLLAHCSGLPGYAPLFERHRTPEGLLRACLTLDLTAAPGEREEYSDIGFILLGKVLEVVSGTRLDLFCGREIFTPLDMASTGYCPPVSRRVEIPPTEEKDGLGRRCVQGMVHDENCFVLGGVAGHAGLFSNAEDVLRFARELLGGGLFAKETVGIFAQRQSEGGSRALGWDTPSGASSSGTLFGERSIGHLGYTGTSLWIDLQRGLAVVLLTNRTWPTRENKAIQAVRPAFHNALLRNVLTL